MKHFKQLFKPVPFLPQYMALLGFALTSYGEVRFKPSTNYVFLVWINAIPKAVITALALSIPAYILNRLQNRVNSTSKSSLIYYLGIVLITVIYTFSQSFIEPAVYHTTPKFFGLFKAAYPRNFIPIFFAISLMGNLYLKLHREIAEKNKALTLIQAQNRVLIESDERSRATLASFLHDRVQASLVTVSMQISEIGKSLKEEDSKRLNSVIAELEHIRAVEVRSAAMRLSPDLSVVGLLGAIRMFAETLEPAVKTKVSVDLFFDSWQKSEVASQEVELGIYRICQQVILNSAIHGRAKNIYIDIKRTQDSERPIITLIITNDGLPMENNLKPGTGLAIISSWSSMLEANFSYENTEQGSVQFVLRIPLKSFM